jgi:hypothetical protein
MRNRIRHGYNRIEPEHALVVTFDNGAPIGLVAPVFVLHVVFAMRIRLPNVDFHPGHRGARRGFHGAQHEKWCTGRVGRDGGPGGQGGRVMCVEGPEDGAFGRGGGFGVVDGVDEEGEPDDVREEDEFLRGRWSVK